MKTEKHLHILWTNADINTSVYMVMMYAKNSMLRHWWDKVTVIIWGETARLAAEEELMQEQIKVAQLAGVEFSACVSCASQLGAQEKLEELGVEVIPWGAPLTELIQSNAPLLTV